LEEPFQLNVITPKNRNDKIKGGFETLLTIKLSLTQRHALGTSEAKQSSFIADYGDRHPKASGFAMTIRFFKAF
jgi:hypothetical protein